MMKGWSNIVRMSLSATIQRISYSSKKELLTFDAFVLCRAEDQLLLYYFHGKVPLIALVFNKEDFPVGALPDHLDSVEVVHRCFVNRWFAQPTGRRLLRLFTQKPFHFCNVRSVIESCAGDCWA